MPPALFCFCHFSDRVLCVCPSQHQATILLPAASYTAEATGMIHHTPLINWNRVELTFCLGLTLNSDSPNLCLPRSWAYRYEPLFLGLPFHLFDYCKYECRCMNSESLLSILLGCI
jgi:hypothetical protein